EPVEQEGIRRARARAAEADLVLWVTDPSAGDRTGRPVPQLSKEAPHWLIENKVDLLAARSTDQTKPEATAAGQQNEAEFIFLISATRGDGVEALFEALSQFVRDYFAGGETAIVTRERHRRALAHTVAALERALAEAQHRDPREELIAEELRQGTLALGRLTGRVGVDDVLDKIFRDFCIGK